MSATRTVMALGASSVVPCFLVRKTDPVEVSWYPEFKLFVGFASTMQWSNGTVVLKSERTGNIKYFDNPVPQRDPEGDIEHWDLKSTEGHTLRIYNT
jgi:hypothetical protein